jgi:hypothetical protein
MSATEQKHTPGPWTAKHTSGAGLSVHANISKALAPRYSDDCPIYHLGNDACTMNIAYELWTQFPRAEWDAMQEANARLIAAAPELLEALQALLAESVYESMATATARAAITKATGATHE